MAAFLDNTEDIILDAVLTDYGRQLLARGDGSFRIVKFALGDDEIDYSTWNTGAVSALKDEQILKTPVLEAFTNNAASLKNKLLTIGIENLLYLPVVKLNTVTGSFNSQFNGFLVSIDGFDGTIPNPLTGTAASPVNGLLNYKAATIQLDQGIDSPDLTPTKSLLTEIPELYENQYNITIDNRLGRIFATPDSTEPEEIISVDDDNIATYSITQAANSTMVTQIGTNGNGSPIAGFKGSRLNFTIRPTQTIQSETVLDRLGQELTLVSSPSTNYKTVRTSVEVTGITTGYSVEIPILFAKKV